MVWSSARSDRRQTWSWLAGKGLEASMSVVLVTHDAFAATYGQRTIELRDGRIVADVGSVDESRGARKVSA